MKETSSYLILNILARKKSSADSFLLALGFTVLTSWNIEESLCWSLWAKAPSQYLQIKEPPGHKTLSAKSSTDRHMVTSLSWSSSLSPLALGAMSLRMTSARASGRSLSSTTWVQGSVMSWSDSSWAPSKGEMRNISIPITLPLGRSTPGMNKGIVFISSSAKINDT